MSSGPDFAKIHTEHIVTYRVVTGTLTGNGCVSRQLSLGVTVFEGEGRDSKRYRLDILTKRNRERELLEIIEEYEPKAFIVSYEPRRFKGGFLVNSMKNTAKREKPDK